MKNVASTRSDLVNLGLELGCHENGKYLFPAYFVCDVAIWFRRIDSVSGGVLEKNSVARREIFAVDNLNGNFATELKQHSRASRNANDKRGHGGCLELYRAALDGNFSTFRAQ